MEPLPNVSQLFGWIQSSFSVLTLIAIGIGYGDIKKSLSRLEESSKEAITKDVYDPKMESLDDFQKEARRRLEYLERNMK